MEKQLVEEYKKAKEHLADAKKLLSIAQQSFDKATFKIIEYMEDSDIVKTAQYEGLGACTLIKPTLYASCKIESQGQLFEYLNQIKRADLIKETVGARALSSLMSQQIEEGKSIPDFITYYLKQNVRFK